MVLPAWLVVVLNGNHSPSVDCGPKTNGAFLTPGLMGGAGSSRTLPVMPGAIAPAASLDR